MPIYNLKLLVLFAKQSETQRHSVYCHVYDKEKQQIFTYEEAEFAWKKCLKLWIDFFFLILLIIAVQVE